MQSLHSSWKPWIGKKKLKIWNRKRKISVFDSARILDFLCRVMPIPNLSGCCNLPVSYLLQFHLTSPWLHNNKVFTVLKEILQYSPMENKHEDPGLWICMPYITVSDPPYKLKTSQERGKITSKLLYIMERYTVQCYCSSNAVAIWSQPVKVLNRLTDQH